MEILLKSMCYKFKLSLLFLGACLIFINQIARAEEYCTKKDTTSKLSLTEAISLAKNSQICNKVGKLKNSHWCNETTGTWWIPISVKMQNCSPTCVVNVVDKSVSVNYMCMGLLRADQMGPTTP
jgi:hypothetical protein